MSLMGIVVVEDQKPQSCPAQPSALSAGIAGLSGRADDGQHGVQCVWRGWQSLEDTTSSIQMIPAPEQRAIPHCARNVIHSYSCFPSNVREADLVSY